MEDIVRAAMAKWPNVPAVFGWLALSARGEWRIRGEPIGNVAIRSFINRNYEHDESGRWFFQNGPQRVYVELELSPWIMRMAGAALHTHTGAEVRQVDEVFADERGQLYFVTEFGAGALDDRDALGISALLLDEAGAALDEEKYEAWLEGRGQVFLASELVGVQRPLCVGRVAAAEVPARFGFQRHPAPDC
jgi:hypothetical protein